jgi:hypothetical protein
MNLKERVERNNINNSINANNNSKFDFDNLSKEEQIFEKSRR